MATRHYTITLPASVGRRVARAARKQKREISEVAAEAIVWYFSAAALPRKWQRPRSCGRFAAAKQHSERAISLLSMTISAPWEIVLAGPARKALERIPAGDRQRIESVLKAMAATPFQGDVKLLEGQPRRFRRRVGAWRIFFSRIGDERRTSITY